LLLPLLFWLSSRRDLLLLLRLPLPFFLSFPLGIRFSPRGRRATTTTCYNKSMPTDPTPDESTIRIARAHSNRSIARRNLLGVADSLAENFVAVIGDGTFVPTRAAYLKLFKQGFDAPKISLTYERIPDRIDVSSDSSQASEQGHWIATSFNGSTAYTGTYAAMWQQTPDGWKLRSELYVTLAAPKH